MLRTIIRVPGNGGMPGLLTWRPCLARKGRPAPFGSLLGEDVRRTPDRRLSPRGRLSGDRTVPLTRSRQRISSAGWNWL